MNTSLYAVSPKNYTNSMIFLNNFFLNQKFVKKKGFDFDSQMVNGQRIDNYFVGWCISPGYSLMFHEIEKPLKLEIPSDTQKYVFLPP